MAVSGGGTIPFELAPYLNRINITKQNCYLYQDNDIVKAHIEIVGTTTTSISGNSAILVNPVVAKNLPKNFTINNTAWQIGATNNLVYLCKTATTTSSGETINLNFDYEI